MAEAVSSPSAASGRSMPMLAPGPSSGVGGGPAFGRILRESLAPGTARPGIPVDGVAWAAGRPDLPPSGETANSGAVPPTAPFMRADDAAFDLADRLAAAIARPPAGGGMGTAPLPPGGSRPAPAGTEPSDMDANQIAAAAMLAVPPAPVTAAAPADAAPPVNTGTAEAMGGAAADATTVAVTAITHAAQPSDPAVTVAAGTADAAPSGEDTAARATLPHVTGAERELTAPDDAPGIDPAAGAGEAVLPAIGEPPPTGGAMLLSRGPRTRPAGVAGRATTAGETDATIAAAPGATGDGPPMAPPRQTRTGAPTIARPTGGVQAAAAAYQATVAAPPPVSPAPASQPLAAAPERTAAAAAPAPIVAQTATTAGAAVPSRTVDQVAGALALSVQEGRTEATISLRPAALGEVKVRIAASADGLVIRISAERDAVGELLRSRMGELRQALAGHQVAVAELHVLHNPPPLPAAAQEGPLWQDRPWSRREQEGGAEDRPGGEQGDEPPEE